MLKSLFHRYRPKAPYDDPLGNKGPWNRFSKAQPHETSEVDLSISGWDHRTKPLKIAALSDFHLGSHADDVTRLSSIVDEVNGWKPDIAVLLGDFMNTQLVGGGRIPPTMIARILSELDTRLGTFAVLGNHDWYYDGHAVWKALEKHGIQVLENMSELIADQYGKFRVIGFGDDQTRNPDTAAVFENLSDTAPAIILAHDPATFSDIPSGPFLTLSGHTHGGQVRLPFIGPVVNASRAPLRWTAGHIVDNDRHLYVVRGLGTSVIPFRWNCPPEIALLHVSG